MSASVYWKPHHHWYPCTVTWSAAGGRRRRQLPDQRDRGHHDDGEDQRGRRWSSRSPAGCCRGSASASRLAALAMPVADRDVDDPALHQDEDAHRDPEDRDEQVLLFRSRAARGIEGGLRCVRRTGSQSKATAVRPRAQIAFFRTVPLSFGPVSRRRGGRDARTVSPASRELALSANRSAARSACVVRTPCTSAVRRSTG